jgi:hypothetical protein
LSAAEPVASQNDQELARRRNLMFVTLGFNELVRVPRGMEAQFRALRLWLDSWKGIGDIEAGMRRQGYDLYLCRHDGRGWRATFYVSGMEHSLTSTVGSALEPTPWRAVQRAAARTLDRIEQEEGRQDPAPGNRVMSELSYKDEAASAYDQAVAHVSTHFLPFLLRAGRLEPGQRVLDAATGTGITAEAALAVVGPVAT